MKAMVLSKCAPMETSPLQWEDIPDLQPEPGQIRVKVKACAICRTDLHIIEGELPPLNHPIIPGHQIVGVVDSVGSECTRFSLGDRIGIAWLRHTCGECFFCRSGEENLCEQSLYTGYHAPGGFAEYAVIDEDFAYPIPDVFSDVGATPLLCAGIIGYRSLMRSQCQPGQRLGLFGFGSSAHIVIQIATYWGCDVYVCTRSKEHQQLALEMGAKWAGREANTIPVLLDSAIIFAPGGDLVPKALSRLRKGGSLALAGIYMSPIPALDYENHLFYEKNIHSVTANTRRDGMQLLQLASQIPLRAQVEEFHIREANHALLRLKRNQIKGTGVLVLP